MNHCPGCNGEYFDPTFDSVAGLLPCPGIEPDPVTAAARALIAAALEHDRWRAPNTEDVLFAAVAAYKALGTG